MDISLASWFVILLALAAANLPFLPERLLGLIPLPQEAAWGRHSMWGRFLGRGVVSLLVGVVGLVCAGRPVHVL